MQEYSLFEAFVNLLGNESAALQVYGVVNCQEPLVQVLFICPGCRRHCSTYDIQSTETRRRIHWCGGVVCNVAGPLSDAVPVHQRVYQLQSDSVTSNPVYLLRSLGCGKVVSQFTCEVRIDASLEMWRTVMSGILANESKIAGVWVPSVTTWKFQAGFVPEHQHTFSWPRSKPVTPWRACDRWQAVCRNGVAVATATTGKDSLYRCHYLCKRMYESNALMAIEDGISRLFDDSDYVLSCVREACPRLNMDRFTVRSTVSRLILYYQRHRSRMREADADALVSLFVALQATDVASRDLPPIDNTPHRDANARCCCSRLQSYLSTYSNRIDLDVKLQRKVYAATSGDFKTDEMGPEMHGRLRWPTERWKSKYMSASGSESPASGSTRTRSEVCARACFFLT